jgi:5'(3')-deoxyribonucleotidase
MHILFDQDGTLNHWGPTGWDLSLVPYGDAAKNIPRHADQRDFNLKLNLTAEEAAIVDEVFNKPHFYLDLEPIEGAVEAFHKTVEAGHKVHIVTSPWWSNPTCLQDKSDWVAKHLGEQYRNLLIFTGDKTAIRGDFLVDDKPYITGEYETPSWEQILFDQPYNQEVSHLHRVTSWEKDWDNYLGLFSDMEKYGLVSA